MSIDLILSERAREPRGRLFIETWQRGRLIDLFEDDNLIVSGLRDVQAHLVGGSVTNNSVTKIGFGTDGTAPLVTNSGLTGATLKAVDSVSYPFAGTVQFGFSLLTTDCNGMAISEFGLFTAASVLIARRVRTAPLNKDNTISLTGNWQISF